MTEYRAYHIKYAEDRSDQILIHAGLVEQFEKNPGEYIDPGYLAIEHKGDLSIIANPNIPLEDCFRGF